jgi:hypothetical protein
MAEQKRKIDPKAPNVVQLRIALEDRDPEGNPDDFAGLIRAMLEAPGDPYVALCTAAFGGYRQREMSFFQDWATGLTAPAPLMRRKVVKDLRAYLAALMEG